MRLKRLFAKGVFFGVPGIIGGHLFDAFRKKKKTGKPMSECIRQSVKETVTEDMPGSSLLFDMGRKEGREQGTAEQAQRDLKKMEELNRRHEEDRMNWKNVDKQKDEYIKDLEKECNL